MNKQYQLTALVALLLLTAGLSARGQEYLQRSDYPGTITSTIVRDYQASSVISYVESGGRHYFSLDDGSPTILNMEIDSSLTVLDFVVHGDYVYFCGENDIPRAIVGWFNVPTFFSGHTGYYVYDFFPLAVSNYAESLTGICAYDNSNAVAIFAVGHDDSGKACALSLSGTAGSAGGWSYAAGKSSEQSERMLKVCATDNYVVTAGTIFNDRDGISLRIFRKSGLFATGGPQDRFHRYSSEDSDPLLDYPLTSSPSTSLALTHLQADSIAVMAEWAYRHPQNPDFSDGMLIHVYDLGNTLNQVNPLADYSVVTHQAASLPSDREVVGLSLNPTSSLLHYAVRGNTGLDMLGELAMPPASIDCRRVPGVDFLSMDDRALSQKCLVQGTNATSSSRLQTYHYLLGQNAASCATTFVVQPDLTQHFREKNHQYPLLTNQSEVDFLEKTVANKIETLKEYDCQQ